MSGTFTAELLDHGLEIDMDSRTQELIVRGEITDAHRLLIRTNRETLILEALADKSPTAHDRKECGCFVGYEERRALHKRGLLWLQERGVSDRGLAVLSERDEELNREWCEASLEEFTDFWRGVVKAAS